MVLVTTRSSTSVWARGTSDDAVSMMRVRRGVAAYDAHEPHAYGEKLKSIAFGVYWMPRMRQSQFVFPAATYPVAVMPGWIARSGGGSMRASA
jgi:hypothetical protein